jgi:hypothetical protein
MSLGSIFGPLTEYSVPGSGRGVNIWTIEGIFGSWVWGDGRYFDILTIEGIS